MVDIPLDNNQVSSLHWATVKCHAVLVGSSEANPGFPMEMDFCAGGGAICTAGAPPVSASFLGEEGGRERRFKNEPRAYQLTVRCSMRPQNAFRGDAGRGHVSLFLPWTHLV